MHRGHLAGTSNVEASPADATSVDDLIANAVKGASAAGTKEKSKKKVNLLYGDNELSPEVKKMQSPRYAFTPTREDVVA